MQGVLEKGYGIIPKILMLDNSINIEAKAIYGYLASYAGNGGSAFPGVDRMISDLSISRERFYKYRKQLIETGYINVKGRKDDKGRQETSLYILNSYISKPQSGKPYTEKLQSEKPQSENTITNSNSINSNSINSNSNKSSSSTTLYSYYEENIGRLITPREVEILNSYIQDGLSEEVIKYAIDEAIERNARNMKYIRCILNRCLDEGKTEIHHLKKKDGEKSGGYNFSRKQDNENNKPEESDGFGKVDF